jgi:N-acetyl sugar amidotransferase
MDTTDSQITFDDVGQCNHCSELLEKRAKHIYQGKESDELLDRIVADIKGSGKGREYDCIIGLSGGADSSYLAYVVKQKGLRPLAVHMDNGWNSAGAVSNISDITKKLEIDYQSYVLDWEGFRELQLSFLRASVPEAETPTDIAIVGALHYFAAKYNIKYILSGGSLATEGILPKSWHYNSKDFKYFKHIHKTFGDGNLGTFQFYSYMREIYYKLIRGIQTIYPLNLVPYSNNDTVEFLMRTFDWKPFGGKHYESSYTRFIQSYYLYEKFGIDYRRAALATQICTGEIRRNDAIGQLQSKPYDANVIEKEMQYISKKLSISRDEFDRILSLPAKWYWDYPNDEKKLSFIYDAYRNLFKKEKLSWF